MYTACTPLIQSNLRAVYMQISYHHDVKYRNRDLNIYIELKHTPNLELSFYNHVKCCIHLSSIWIPMKLAMETRVSTGSYMYAEQHYLA